MITVPASQVSPEVALGRRAVAQWEAAQRRMNSRDLNGYAGHASLPTGCSDLIDVIRLRESGRSEPPAEPPLTSILPLPELVSVRFIAEVLGLDLSETHRLIRRFHTIWPSDRAIPFEVAAKVLRTRGILADRARPTTRSSERP